ncbi:NYN domain-containing protein [Pleurocapsales cyanobacterium LEGE 06147]|nr:NYN domain-containing protein [Pleurocapsales cyanobacterium LEGE 06147]
MYSNDEKLLYSYETESVISWSSCQIKASKSERLGESHKTKIDADTNIPIFNNLNRGRIAIFIDGANLFYAALQLGIEVNYTKLLHCLTGSSQLLRPFFYTGVDTTNEKQHNFLLWMRRNGYRVIAKELIEFPDGSKKADLDVEIAIDMMTLVGHYDTAVLVSGDGDLAYAVNAVSYRGVRIEVVSLRSMTSDSLINYADAYVDLNEIRDYIKKSSYCDGTYKPRGCDSNLHKVSESQVMRSTQEIDPYFSH